MSLLLATLIVKAEHWRIDAFELWCWRKLLRVPWTARRSNQSILKDISPECSLEGLVLKLKLQYFAHLMQRADSFESPWCQGRLKAGGEGDDRGWGGWMASPTQWTWVWVSSGSWRWTGRPGVLQCMGLQRLSDWTELNRTSKLRYGPLLVNGIQGTNLCENYQETKTKRKQGASKMGQALKYIKKRIQNTWRRTDCLNT